MASLAILQPQWKADRIKLIAVNNKERTDLVPGVPTAREQGYPSLVFEGLHGLIGRTTTPQALKEKIAADFKEAAADGTIAARLAATGQVINVGGPDEFAAAIEEQRSAIAATVKAINFKPKN
jgi:tripartite-type tricarboxylate transporter receptor subunit TctC